MSLLKKKKKKILRPWKISSLVFVQTPHTCGRMFRMLLKSSNSRRVCVCVGRSYRWDCLPAAALPSWTSGRFLPAARLQKHIPAPVLIYLNTVLRVLYVFWKTLWTSDIETYLKKQHLYSTWMWSSPVTILAEKYWLYIGCPLWHHQAHCEMRKCVLLKVAPNGLWRFAWQAAEMVLWVDFFFFISFYLNFLPSYGTL